MTSMTGVLTHAVPRTLRSVADQRSLIIQGRSIDIYTGALSLSISPGRVLYTGRSSVTISYKNETTPILQTRTLEPYTGYEFSSITDIATTA